MDERLPCPQESVLCIDDHHDTCELLSLVLSQQGLHVFAAATKQQALQGLERQSYSLMVVDFYLPDGDASTLCQTARALTPDLPILLVSSQTFTPAEVQKLGATAYLQKPLEIAEFTQVVQTLLSSDRSNITQTDAYTFVSPI